MLRCRNCGETFFETDIKTIYEPEYGYIGVCPHCDDFDMEEISKCAYCGEWFPEEEIDNGLCEECAGKTIVAFNQAMHALFTEEQIDYLSQVDLF